MLLSYSPDLRDLARGVASYVDRILRGAPINDLPIQYPTAFKLTINLKTAKAIGLDGDVAVSLMNGATVMSSGALGNMPTTWTVVGVGDFNGDGKADLLWRDNLGNTSIWFMNGTAVASSAAVGNIPINWSVVGTGDFNGDGKCDIVWRDTAGDTSIWLMNGRSDC
jgi:FG-GAP-like repeat